MSELAGESMAQRDLASESVSRREPVERSEGER
ncbi:MAG: hypothetical protein V7646_4266 [Pseudonocardia sp.]|jgi:hypothetical protein